MAFELMHTFLQLYNMLSEIPLTSVARIQLRYFGISSFLFAGVPAHITQMLAFAGADFLLERFSTWVEKRYIDQGKDKTTQDWHRRLLRKADKV
jgi:hypothetical protein